jgi:nitroreductase
MSKKEAKNVYPIHGLLKQRWSPRAFSEKVVEKEKLQSVFEAARWSPSSYNQQPWRFIVGRKGDATYEKIMDALGAFNQRWAITAPVLVATLGRKFNNNSEENNLVYQYDAGQSVAHMSVEATNRGLYVHQMGGFDPKKIIKHFEVPVQYKPLTVLAIGYIGDPEQIEESLKKAELAERDRFDFDDFVFSGNFGGKSGLFD